MLKFLNKYKKFIIAFSFAYVYILVVLLAPSKFTATTPGEINNVEMQYVIEDVEIPNNFNVVSVYSWKEITIFQKWLIQNNQRYALRKQTDFEQNLSLAEYNLQGRISNQSSHDNAVIAAYTKASKVNNDIKIDYKLNSLTVYYTTNPDLKIGDEIIEINNREINTNSFEDYLTELSIYNEINPNQIFGKNLNLRVLRNGEQVILTHKLDEGIVFYPNYEIIKTTPSYEGLREQINRGGPSGGMIQALAIYSGLLNISYKDIVVAGTGTINTDNSFSVGRIGGLIQKYFTITDNKVDVFIIPTSHYLEIPDEIKNDFTHIIMVDDFDDLISEFIAIYGDYND